MRCRARVAVPFLLCLVALLGCATRLDRITMEAAGRQITVEVAKTEAEREHGLMGRRSMGETDGMLFVFDRDQRMAFWMKDTPLPLSIAFLSAEGKVLEIEDMQPFSEAIIHSRLSARYALEMNQGAFGRLGIHEGDTFTFPKGFLD